MKIHNYITLYISKLPKIQTNLSMDSVLSRITLTSFSSCTHLIPHVPNVETCRPQIKQALKEQVRWMPPSSLQLGEPAGEIPPV